MLCYLENQIHYTLEDFRTCKNPTGYNVEFHNLLHLSPFGYREHLYIKGAIFTSSKIFNGVNFQVQECKKFKASLQAICSALRLILCCPSPKNKKIFPLCSVT